MNTELIDVSPVHKEIKIEIEPAEIKPLYDQTLARYAKLATVPGFRKGYAPRDVVKLRFREDIQNDVLRELLPNRVTEAIQEHNLQPLSEPQLHLDDAENLNITSGANIGLHVHVEVMPKIDAPTYQGLEAVRRVRPVDESEVEKMIQDRRAEQASLTPVEDRAAAAGDTVRVDIDGKFVDDAAAEPIHVEDLEIEIGGENIQKEFTDALTGANPDEVKTFTVAYPADFTSEGLAGKTIEYAATVKSIGHVELPELNDEWAQSLSEADETYESMSDLRNQLRQNLESMAKMESDNRLREELMNKMIDANPVDVPPTLTNYQAQGLAKQFAQNMEQQGVDMRNADQKLWQMLFQRMLPQAEREVRGALLLDKVAEVENVEISPDEISAEYETLAKYSGRTADEVRELLKQQENGEAGVSERLRNRKAVEFLVNSAVITEGEWTEEAPDAGILDAGDDLTTEAADTETIDETAADEAVTAETNEETSGETAKA